MAPRMPFGEGGRDVPGPKRHPPEFTGTAGRLPRSVGRREGYTGRGRPRPCLLKMPFPRGVAGRAANPSKRRPAVPVDSAGCRSGPGNVSTPCAERLVSRGSCLRCGRERRKLHGGPASVAAVSANVHADGASVAAVSASVHADRASVAALGASVRAVRANVHALRAKLQTLCASVPAVRGNAHAVRASVPALCASVPALCASVPALCASVPAVRGKLHALCAAGPLRPAHCRHPARWARIPRAC
jgi:hypothetical protein